MTFFRPLRRYGLRVLAPLAAAAALLTACGGGTSQVQAFVPARLLVVGDETGMLVDVDNNQDGYRYGLNDRTTAITATTAHCQLLQTPAQQVATHYNLRFKECNPLNDKGERPAANALALAKAGALADDATTGLKAQIDGITGLGKTDMVLVTIGTNDIIDVYLQRTAGTWTTNDQAIAEARRRATVVAGQINLVLATGARALVFTVPVLGKSPYALTKSTTDQALITDLTTAFNAAMRRGIDATDYDGRNYGLVLADDVTAAMERFPKSYLNDPANTTLALCPSVAAPQDCHVVTTATATEPTLVKSDTHLWVSDRFVGPRAHIQIGAQAVSRAANNPF